MPVEELFKKPKNSKNGRRGQWTEHLADDLVDIILVNDKYKEESQRQVARDDTFLKIMGALVQ